MVKNAKVVEITPDNFLDSGIVCGSKAQFTEGRLLKMKWYCKQFEKGLRMKIVVNNEGVTAGMIEYVPGEFCWRTIHAEGYTVIHCLQVARNQTRKGFGRILLNECIKDSKSANGIAIVTSSKPWVNDKQFFLKNSFTKISAAPPYYELLVRQFQDEPLPYFNNGWDERALQYGEGITVLYSDQCPIIEYALKNLKDASMECNLKINYHKIEDCTEAQNAPFAYGTFGIIKNGKFITHRIFDKEQYVTILKD